MATDSPTPTLRFGPFQLLRTQRQLLAGREPVRLSSRALDVLIALVERAGELVSREELMAWVWPCEVVEENTLRVHVAALRKALGDGQQGARYISTVAGRGYCFVAEVQRVLAVRSVDAAVPPSALAGDPPGAAMPGGMPAGATSLLGRQATVAALARQLRQRRFVSIVGAGGLGKTCVALAVAESERLAYPGGVFFADLSVLPAQADAGQLQQVLARALPCPLDGQPALLVLDNCEQVLDALAGPLEALRSGHPALHLLATSREPLRSAGEWVHLLPALDLPPSGPIDAARAARYPAVQLFAERATASDDRFGLDDGNVAAVVAICRQLDGLPLAIELVAALVHVFGLGVLAAGLDARFLQLSAGRRRGAARHQTLAALLDWSYQLLDPLERRVLQRLAVLRAGMAMDDLEAVAAHPGTTPARVREAICRLVSKSWLFPEPGGDPVRLRLHGLARIFAEDLLAASGELEAVRHRHAACLAAAARRAAAQADARAPHPPELRGVHLLPHAWPAT